MWYAPRPFALRKAHCGGAISSTECISEDHLHRAKREGLVGAAPRKECEAMKKNARLFGSMIAVSIPLIATATVASGVILNNILAKGTTAGALKEDVEVADGSNEWSVELTTNGASDFYYQEFILAPGGYSGWHSHPGVLMITVAAGTVDWYDKDCGLHRYVAGQSFTENAELHNVLNTGTVDAHLLGSYVIQKNAPRRIDQPQPTCGAAATPPIP